MITVSVVKQITFVPIQEGEIIEFMHNLAMPGFLFC